MIPTSSTSEGLGGTSSPGLVGSPSLLAAGNLRAAAYELKFLLSETLACEVERLVRSRLSPDPHGNGERGAYRVTTLCFDTASLDVFHRQPGFRRRKYRLRRYDDGDCVFLERKSKWGDRVRKQRTSVAATELTRLVGNVEQPGDVASPAEWFRCCLVRRRLQPTCQVAYERVALVGGSNASPLRVTFDRHLRGSVTDAWRLDSLGTAIPILDDQVICEFKYHESLPSFFKEVIETLRLSPRPVSKYRTFMEAVQRA